MRLILAGLLLASTVCFAQVVDRGSQAPFNGPATSDFLPVAEAYGLEVEVISERQLRLFWRIAPEYYLYQHRFDFTLQDEQGDIGIDAQLPAAITHTDDFFGEVQIYYHGVDMILDLSRDAGRATMTATSQGCANAGLCYPPYTLHFDLNFETGAVTPATPAPTPDASPPLDTESTSTASTGGTLAYMLILAFLGGSILNLMPCVFPVLSLKVLSFARNTDHDRHLHSWVYTAGVISSFVAVAALLIVLQQAGQAIGWGFQLQSPGFVIALAYLFIAMGLSLTGMVELGSNLMNTGSGLADQSGLGGSFFTGVLAVVVASPCTAPFMGTALGFAVSQPPLIGLTVFAALGAGMAAPLLVFSYSGAARAIMPKPGPWMETLKQFLSFPLYATAIWLLWVAGRQTGVNTMAAALLGELLLALGLWLWRVNWWRRSLALACLAGAIALASMRGLDGTAAGSNALSKEYLPWTESEVVALRNAGRPVFVDVTADWCITCKANETTVLFTDDITAAFAEHGVVYMIADWTNEDPKIAELLKKHQRNGIPLYLMYSADPAAAPLILPQLLTKRMVIDALEEVSVKNSPMAAISH